MLRQDNTRNMQNYNRFMEMPMIDKPRLPEWKMRAINGRNAKSYYHPKPLDDDIYRNKIGPYNDNKLIIRHNNRHREQDRFYDNRSKGRLDFQAPGDLPGTFRIPDSLIAKNVIRPLLPSKRSYDRTIEEKHYGIIQPSGATVDCVPRHRTQSVLQTHLKTRSSTQPQGRRNMHPAKQTYHSMTTNKHPNAHTVEDHRVIRTLNKLKPKDQTGSAYWRQNNGSVLNKSNTNRSYVATSEEYGNRRTERSQIAQRYDRANTSIKFNNKLNTNSGYNPTREWYNSNHINRPPQYTNIPTYLDIVHGNINNVANYDKNGVSHINDRIEQLFMRKSRK